MTGRWLRVERHTWWSWQGPGWDFLWCCTKNPKQSNLPFLNSWCNYSSCTYFANNFLFSIDIYNWFIGSERTRKPLKLFTFLLSSSHDKQCIRSEAAETEMKRTDLVFEFPLCCCSYCLPSNQVNLGKSHLLSEYHISPLKMGIILVSTW